MAGSAAALLDPAAGLLRAARCLAALRNGARRAGADLRFGSRVRGWTADGGLTVQTDGGELRAGALLVAAGGWTADLLAEAGEPRPPLTVERQSVHRFPPPDGGSFAPERFLCFLQEGTEAGGRGEGPLAYGAPDLGRGVKVALHHDGEQSPRPEKVRRRPGPAEARRARQAVDDLLPSLGFPPGRGLPLHGHAGPGLPDRPAVAGRRAGGRGLRLLGPRLQVGPHRGRDHGGSAHGEPRGVDLAPSRRERGD